MTILRSTLFNFWFYGLTLLFSLAGCVMAVVVPRGPTPAWAISIARAWAGLVLGGLRMICGTSWEVTGREHLPPEGAALIASMHQSAFDTLVWLLLTPLPCYVLKRELIRMPVFGLMCRLTGMIAVDRGAGAGAIRSLFRGADRALCEQRQIVIFPEGSRMPPGQRGVVQPGIAALASRTGLPVIPVVTDSGRCWGKRAFKKLPGVIHVVILPPIPGGLSRAELMPRLEAAFAQGDAALSRP